ncbi:MAG: hypothetical protein IMF08_00115 [Proteobacteria bacterium]|nr:hypothetical protein [Pseudomonadota bacterium]
MYIIPGPIKRDPHLRWNLPDRVFFTAGACHILAWAFMDRHAHAGFRAVWVKPSAGFTGNHIVAVRGDLAFDCHGYSDWPALLAHMREKAGRWWPGWNYTLVELPADVLVSEAKSLTYDGLHLREPGQFLHDALPRARGFLDRFPAPPPAPIAGGETL